jgi:hypothetical protein
VQVLSQAGHSTGNGEEVVGPGPLHAEVVGGAELHVVVGGAVVVMFLDVLGGGAVVVICFDVLGGGGEVVDGGALGFGTFDPGAGTLPVPP